MNSGMLALVVLIALMGVVAGLVYGWCIPISAFLLYRMDRSRGWLLIAVAFGFRLTEITLYTLLMLRHEARRYVSGDSFASIREMIYIVVLAVALAGFIMVVTNDGRNRLGANEVHSCD